MVKVKTAKSVAPLKAVALEKTIKKKQHKKADKKLADATEPEQVHVPLVALSKPAKKLKFPAKKEKEIKEKVEISKPVKGKSEHKVESIKEPAVKDKKSKASKKTLATQASRKNGGKIEKPNLIKQPQLAKKVLAAPLVADEVKQTKKTKVPKNKKPSDESEEIALPTVETEAVGNLPKFDEKEFLSIVKIANIKKIAKSLKSVVQEEVSKKKNSLFTDYRYFLNVACFKIADCPKRVVKLNLKHSLVDKENDNVLIVVHDLKRGAKVDYEPTIQHYTDLFRKHGVDELGYRLTIMPFNQLRQEYKTFEAKRKLAATYEHFLCDARVVGHAVGYVGKTFQKPRTTFHAVHLDKNDKIKERIERGLRRTAFKQLHKGDLISIPVGNHSYSIEHLAENVHLVIQQLKTLYPGSYENIRSMQLKIDLTGTSSLPIFISNCAAPAVTPYVVGPKEKHLLKLKREANAVLQKFDLDKNGVIKRLTQKQTEKKQKTMEYKKNMAQELALKNKTTDKNGKPAKRAKLEIKANNADDDDDNNDDGDDHEDENDDDDDEDED